ncbi:MAG: DUF4349 domain-containing protein [Spirochaetota bacterium]|nr:DUF4349 domain-containing protein [Spirochaetota bacterium]
MKIRLLFILLILLMTNIFLSDCSDKRESAGSQSSYDPHKGQEDNFKQDGLRAKSKGLFKKKTEKAYSDPNLDELQEEKEKDERKPSPKNTYKKTQRMVIYKADYSLAVDRVKDTVKALELIIKKYKGYVDSVKSYESYKRAVITLRVPVKSFDSSLKELSKLGVIEKKSISARDVTEEFHDNSLRLDTHKKILLRLQTLLRQTYKAKERIKILKEIQRISAEIESIESRQKFLQNQASFSTIIVRLRSNLRHNIRRYLSSPFPWIRELASDKIWSFERDQGLFFKNYDYSKPKGFFSQKENYEGGYSNYLLTNPGNSAKLRLGITTNYPKTTIDFWDAAIEKDSNNRKYKKLNQIDIQSDGIKLKGNIYHISMKRIYFYAIAVRDDEILVAEGLFDGEAIYQEHKDSVDNFLKSIRW